MKIVADRDIKQRPLVYLVEFNRALRSTRRMIDFFERRGIAVTRIAHLTALLLERPTMMSWDKFKDLLRSLLKPIIGSLVLSSCMTGRVFLCSNRGNQPGRFQLVASNGVK